MSICPPGTWPVRVRSGKKEPVCVLNTDFFFFNTDFVLYIEGQRLFKVDNLWLNHKYSLPTRLKSPFKLFPLSLFFILNIKKGRGDLKIQHL